MRALLATILLGLAGYTLSAQDPVPVLSLDQCIALALANGDDMLQAISVLAAARAQYDQAAAKNALGLGTSFSYGTAFQNSNNTPSSTGTSRSSSNYLPQTIQGSINLNSPTTKIGITGSQALQFGTVAAPTSSSTTGANITTLGATITQSLFDGYEGGQANAPVQKAALVLRGQELVAESARIAAITKVKQAYFTLLSAQENVTVLQAIDEKQRTFLDQLAARFKLQQATIVDYKDAEINARSSGIDLQNGLYTLKSSRIKLANLIGKPPTEEFRVTAFVGSLPKLPDLKAAVQTAFAKRTELRQLEFTRQAAEIDLALAKAQGGLSLSITGGATLTFNTTNQSDSQNLSAVLSLGLPLIDSGNVRASEQVLAAQRQVYQAQGAQLQKTVQSAVEDAWNALDVQLQRLDLASLTVDKLSAQLEITNLQSSLGTATSKDVLTAEVNLFNARFAVTSASIAAQTALLQLQTAMGITGEDHE